MPAGPVRWWDLWWSFAADRPEAFDVIAAQPIYRLWWLAERRLATQDLQEAQAERRKELAK